MNNNYLGAQVVEDAIVFSNWNIIPQAQGSKTLKALSGAIKKLAQALSEVIDNIIDADGNTAEFFVKNSKTSGKFDIFVRDNGTGLDHEKIQKMFKIGASASNKGYSTMGWKGVGIKAAAHAACQKFWVIGREENGIPVAAFMDFSIDVLDWNDPNYSNVFHGYEEITQNAPKELLELIPDLNVFTGCVQMFNNITSKMINQSPNVDSIVKKILQTKTERSRTNLSYIYREILNKKIKITVNGQHLVPSGHGFENTPEGIPLSHRYFRDQHATGQKLYNIIDPDGLTWEIMVHYTLSFKYDQNTGEITKVTSTPNQGQVHLLRNEKEITTCKIPIHSYGNNYSIGELHIDVHLPPKFVDTHSELASEKSIKSLSAIGPDDYNFAKILTDLLRNDIELAIAYNKVNFLNSEDDDKGGHGKSHYPEFIYRDLYYDFLKQEHRANGKSEEEIASILVKESSNSGLGTRNDIINEGVFTEIKVIADHNSITQCLGYMMQRGIRECVLLTIEKPVNYDKFKNYLKNIENFYNVKISLLDASDKKKNYFLNMVMNQKLTAEQELAVKKAKKKKN